jgi:putative transposase
MRYIELNPVRAGMVDNPGQYPWSSFRAHVDESVIDRLSESEKYRRLAATQEARKLAYRDLFNQPLATRDIESIRMHLNKDPLGSSQFQDEIAPMPGRRAKIAPMGRPKKAECGGKKLTCPFFPTPFSSGGRHVEAYNLVH